MTDSTLSGLTGRIIHDETVAALAINIGNLGKISVQTQRGFTSGEMDAVNRKVA